VVAVSFGFNTPPIKPNLKSSLRIMLNYYINKNYFFPNNYLSDEMMMRYLNKMNRIKPIIVRGQPCVLSLIARFIRDNDITLYFKPKAIFTKSEKLFQHQRRIIESVFDSKVFETYGLNDGGVSAYECINHNGMHIRTERSILEVVDAYGNQIVNENGRMLATSLYNYALPFIRYDIGDMGILSDETCDCGNKTRLLKEVTGRIQDFVYTPDGTKIFGQFFSHIFDSIRNVSQFQVIQDRTDEIVINIIPDRWQDLEEIDVTGIKDIMANRYKKLEVNIRLVTEKELKYTEAGKYKFVINNIG
jgi:phenylacetate-CoA ligase